MEFQFAVKGDQLYGRDGKANTGSLNYYTCSFDFDPTWDGLICMAAFRKDNVPYGPVQIIDGKCAVPPDVIDSTGYFEVGVYGSADIRISTNWCCVSVSEGTYRTDYTSPATPTPDLWEQYLSQMQAAVDSCSADQTAASLSAADANTNAQTTVAKAAEALQSASDALKSAQDASNSATNAETSNQSALQAMLQATQALSDLLAMLGTDIATLTNGKLTPSQIPSLSINDVFEVYSIADMLTLNAQRGDVALVLVDDNIHDSYMLAVDDPTVELNWKKLGISYVANAGHALTADNATNSDKINNKRIVGMTQSQYDNAVTDEDTYYIVVPD